MKTGHEIAWERAKVLDSNDRQRVDLEAWYSGPWIIRPPLGTAESGLILQVLLIKG